MTHLRKESAGGDPWGVERDDLKLRTTVRLRALGVAQCLSIVAVSFLLVVVVAVGIFFAALARGPIASDWLVPKLVESLEELYTHRYEFDLGSASIASTSHGLTLSVDGLAVKMGGRTIVAAPRAELSIELRSLLLGRLMPSRLEALDLELRLAVMPNGVVAISAAGADPIAIPIETPPPEEQPPEPPPSAGSEADPLPGNALLAHAGAALRTVFDLATSPDSPIGAIDRVGVSHARLVIDDRTLDRTLVYRDLALSFDKSTGAMSFSLAATGPSGRWSAEATAKGAPGSRRALDLELRRLSLDEIMLAGGIRSLPFDTDAPLSFSLHFALAEDGRVLEASGRFAAGEGFFRLEEPDHEPFMISKLTGAARWETRERRFVLDPIEIEAGGAQLTLAGSILPPSGDAGSDFWALSVDLARPGVFGSERPNEKSVVVDVFGISAKVALAAKRATIERISIEGPEVHAKISGALDWAEGPHLKGAIQVAQTPVRSVLRLWPTHAAAPTRAWLDAHVPEGVLRQAALTLDFDQATMIESRYERPPPDDALRGDFDIADGVVVDILPGLAPITGVAGSVRLTGRTVSFAIASGVLESAPGRRLSIESGSFRVPALGFDPAQAVVDLRLSGGAEAVADILALESVAAVARLPIDAATVKGQVDGRLRIDFEIGKSAREEHTRVSVDVDATKLSIERFIGKERLEDANLKIVSDASNGLRVWGVGRVFGAPVTLDVRRPPGAKSQPAQALLSLSLDDASRARAGVGFAGVSGVVGAQIATKLPIEDADAQVELDFTKAALDNPLPGVTKPAGKPGKAAFNLVKRPDGSALEQLTAEGNGVQLAGIVELGRDGAFRSAKLSQARLSPGDDMRIEATRAADALKLVVRGSNIDARPLLRYLTQPSSERAVQAGAGKPSTPSSEDFDLDLKAPIVTGFGKQILANVDLKFERRGGKPRLLALRGSFGREPFAALLVRHPSGAPQVDLSTSDGGSLLAFLDLYQRMESGALTASILLGQGRSDGTLQIHDFYLQNEPAMRQLVMQGASRLDDKGVLRFDPDSVKFSRVQAGFTWSNGKLSIRDAVMSGSEIGLTVDGYIDLARDRIDVSGSFVPAYGLNSLLSNIPVLGLVLAGGRHEGVFAMSFRVSGAFSAPVLTVNPLSVIAPGLLRKVFGILDGTGPVSESAPLSSR